MLCLLKSNSFKSYGLASHVMGIWSSDAWLLDGSVNLDNLGIVLSAYRSFLHQIAYVSMPIIDNCISYRT